MKLIQFHTVQLQFIQIKITRERTGFSIIRFKNASTSIIVHSPLLVDQVLNVVKEFEKEKLN